MLFLSFGMMIGVVKSSIIVMFFVILVILVYAPLPRVGTFDHR